MCCLDSAYAQLDPRKSPHLAFNSRQLHVDGESRCIDAEEKIRPGRFPSSPLQELTSINPVRGQSFCEPAKEPDQWDNIWCQPARCSRLGRGIAIKHQSFVRFAELLVSGRTTVQDVGRAPLGQQKIVDEEQRSGERIPGVSRHR
jgi:hypothetical protein